MSKKIIHTSKKEVLRRISGNDNYEINRFPCEICGGIRVTKYGAGMSCTFCVDCGEEEYDYDL